MTLYLKPFETTDYNQWLTLWKGYQAFYNVDIKDTISQITYERLLSPHEPMHGYFAIWNNQPVAFVHYIEHRSCWSEGNYCYLQDLFTHPDHRGQGIARQLINHVYQHASTLGCSRVYWLTQDSNHSAMRLYDQLADKPGIIQYRKQL